MKSIVRFVALFVLMATFTSLPAAAQNAVQRNCDSGCGGAIPTGGPISFITGPNAGRGMGSLGQPSFAPLKSTRGGEVTVEGSQSFTYSVPLFSISGRNGLDVNLTLYYNSFIWTVMGNSIVLNADRDEPSPGFRLDFGYVEGSDTDAVLVDPTGGKHLLVPTGTSSGVSTDSTYIQAQIASTGNVIWVTYKNGLLVTYNVAPSNASLFRPAQFKDTNGNIFSIFYQDDSSTRLSQIIDDTGRKINFSYDPANPTELNSVTEVSAGGVSLRTYTFSWRQSLPIYIAFTEDTGSLANATGTNPSTINVLTGVTRPDGTQVSFGYANWGLVGQVSELSAPDANGNRALRYSTSYNWPIAGNGFLSANPTFTQQTIFDGVNTGVWNSVAQRNSAGVVTNFSVTDPLSTTTATTFSAAGDKLDGTPIQELICSSSPCTPNSGNILRTTNTTWALDASGINPHRTSFTTILEDGSTQSQVKFNAYDTHGNLTDQQEFDYGPAAPGALLRRTLTTFASPGNNIFNRPSRIVVQNGNGTTVTRTDFAYDENPVTDFPSNPAGHDPAYTSSITARGNATSVTKYANAAAGTGAVVATYSYDAAGSMIGSREGSGPQTQRTLSTATQYALPDSVSVGPAGSQLTSAFTYNDNGQGLTSVDPNGQRTSNTYDAAGRLKTTQTPDGIVTTNTYDDVGAHPSVSTSSTANSLVTTMTSDGSGRAIGEQILNGTSVVSTVSQTNDVLGRATYTSNPYGPGETAVSTAYSYDPLGRAVRVTPPAIASVAQTPYATSYSGVVVTVQDPAGLQKKQYFDGLGRLVRVDEPGLLGGAAAGTVTMTGAEQSVPSNSVGNGATAGTASISFAATAACSSTIADRCNTQVVQQATHNASVTITLSGSDGTNVNTACRFCKGVKDTGTLGFTVNVGGTVVSSSAAGGYGGTSNPSTLAQALASGLAANSVVQVSNGPVTNADGSASFTLSTVPTGSSMNNSTISAGFTSSCLPSDTMVCQMNWRVSLSGPNLSATTPAPSASANFSGGLDQILVTKYDTGTLTVGFTVNNTLISEQVSYGQADTAASVAQAFVTKFSQDANATSYVTAGSSGGVLNLTTVATGAGTNYPLTLSSATNSQYFGAGSTSFSVTSPSSSFVQGQQGILYDSGTITATLNGFSTENPPTETVNFGQGSTAAGLAAALVAKMNADPQWQALAATLPAGSSSITFTAKSTGTDANGYSVSINEKSNQSASFPSPSFPNVSGQLSGGSVSTPSFDPSVVLTTTYNYDPMGNLLQVHQGQQTRRYTYDGLNELLSAQTPEAGYNATSYTYKDFGAVATKTDPRLVPTGPGKGATIPIMTTYGYDTLARLNDIAYNDGTPEVTFSYGAAGAPNNGAGRLSSITDGTGSKTYQYDLMGRLTQVSQTIAGTTYTTGFSYNAAGGLSRMTYPSGRIVQQSYDSIGRLCAVGGTGVTCTSGTIYVSGLAYNAAGQLLALTYGNGMTGSYFYNPQMQLATLRYASGAGPVLDLAYGYGQGSDNGQIQDITDKVVSARSTKYVYDELGRLQVAQTTDQSSSNTWKLKFTYDRYGNRLSETPVGGTALMPMNEVLVDPATNHLVGAAYDAAGDVTSDGSHQYGFDAEGRLTSVDGSANNYTYDSGGFRVVRNGTAYVAFNGRVIAEYPVNGAASAPAVEYVYLAGRLLSTITNSSINYHYWDHISIRSTADSSGTVLRTYGHFPFGETWYENGPASKWKFASYENDSESGNHYAENRFLSGSTGRFLRPDPAGLSAARLDNPQTLNLYSYVHNDPINFGDPHGLDCVYLNDAGDTVESVDHNSSQEECSGTGGEGGNGGFWVDGTFLGGWFMSDSDAVVLVGSNGDGTFNVSRTTPGSDDPRNLYLSFNHLSSGDAGQEIYGLTHTDPDSLASFLKLDPQDRLDACKASAMNIRVGTLRSVAVNATYATFGMGAGSGTVGAMKPGPYGLWTDIGRFSGPGWSAGGVAGNTIGYAGFALAVAASKDAVTFQGAMDKAAIDEKAFVSQCMGNP